MPQATPKCGDMESPNSGWITYLLQSSHLMGDPYHPECKFPNYMHGGVKWLRTWFINCCSTHSNTRILRNHRNPLVMMATTGRQLKARPSPWQKWRGPKDTNIYLTTEAQLTTRFTGGVALGSPCPAPPGKLNMWKWDKLRHSDWKMSSHSSWWDQFSVQGENLCHSILTATDCMHWIKCKTMKSG